MGGLSLRPSIFENEMVVKKKVFVATKFSKDYDNAGLSAVFVTVGR